MGVLGYFFISEILVCYYNILLHLYKYCHTTVTYGTTTVGSLFNATLNLCNFYSHDFVLELTLTNCAFFFFKLHCSHFQLHIPYCSPLVIAELNILLLFLLVTFITALLSASVALTLSQLALALVEALISLLLK